MHTTLTWHGIVVRLLVTAACSGALGFDRDRRGRPAGLRTILLIGLAACLSMIQANWLINSNGKPQDSFVVMDIMRLPLGILSGIGFIGAGAIVKRGELAVGVTTAATIWFVTVMGLCFGGGQIGLGFAGFLLGFAILIGLKRVETYIPQQHSADLTITLNSNGLDQEEITSMLIRNGFSPIEQSASIDNSQGSNRTYGWKIRWRGKREEANSPHTVRELATYPGVVKMEFTR